MLPILRFTAVLRCLATRSDTVEAPIDGTHCPAVPSNEPERVRARPRTSCGATPGSGRTACTRAGGCRAARCTLHNPVFDIHYNSRLEGHNFAPGQKLPYALVVSVQAKGVADLYNQIVRRYSWW